MPGIGTILSLVRLYEIQQIDRFPQVQEFASSCRLVKWAKEAAGKRSGTSGTKIGNAHRPWAFSEAAVFFLRDNPAGQKFLARLEQKPRQGKALTLLAHQLARAVYDLVKHKTAFERQQFVHGYGRGVGEFDAELDDHGMPLTRYALHETNDNRTTASLNADERIGP